VIDTIEIQALACLLIHIIHHEDAIKVEEKLFVYGAGQKNEVNKYISSKIWLIKT
jgi:hypothetical protein